MVKKLISTTLIGLCSLTGVTSCTAKASEAKDDTTENKIEKTDMKTDGKKLSVICIERRNTP